MVGALRWLAVVVAVLAALPGLAQDVVLRVPRTTFEVGETGGFQVVVRGARPTATPRLTVSDDVALLVRYAGQSTMQSIINGRRTLQTRYDYSLTGLREGTYTLGPVSVELGMTTATAAPVVLTVTPRQEAPSAGESAELIRRFDTDSAWEGQVVMYQRGYRSAEPVLRDAWQGIPEEGLLAPRDGKATVERTQIEQPDGSVLHQSIETFPRVAVSVGARVYKPTVVSLQFQVIDPSGRLMRRTRSDTRLTDEVSLNIRARPPAPADFSGLVGQFRFESVVAKSEARVGESVRWTVDVFGDGTMEGFDLPSPPKTEGVKVYDGELRTGAAVRDGKYLAQARFSRVIVPTRGGRLVVEPVQVVVFDTERGEYITHTIELPPIDVLGGASEGGDLTSYSQAAEGDTDAPVEVPWVGVRDIDRRTGLHTAWLGGLMPWALGLSALPLVGLLGLRGARWGVGQVARRRRERPVVIISPLKRLAHLPPERDARLAELDGALRHALARHEGVELRELVRAQAVTGLDDALAVRVRALTHALDLARFAGSPVPSSLEADLLAVVREIEALPRPEGASQ